eukprot:CAMPEP_0114696588 /NCGR_PEP_ID=MMETSP0191-20121206/72744_1 /TAXON_ID=126664 /ORGANISM="Sorites sp." /LENGTH=193 /DNA_ID=CAMNT_0001994453 /DNA_START=326 /DNA_END=904 /DNA_ORIENTATION=+
MGWGMTSDGKTVDNNCKRDYGNQTCQDFYQLQQINYTLLDAMQDIGYDVHLIGKVDVGANILYIPEQKNATADGFHGGPDDYSGLATFSRSANILKPTKAKPVADENDNNVHPEDWGIASNCIDQINKFGANKDNQTKPWMVYCSINIPHPAFQTNATWLAGVNQAAVTLPIWPDESTFHPADEYQSISKNVW